MHKQVLFKIREIEFYFREKDTALVSGRACLDKLLPEDLVRREALK